MRLPTDTQRLCILGRTGSGKTQAAAWHLSLRSWDIMPWIVYDFKRDDLLNSIPGVRHIETSDVPKHPGIYMVHPHPDDILSVHEQLRRIWERENIGIYVDEGYMMCSPGRPNPWFRTILTQGRSMHIPVIILSQRPVWLDRFVFTESEFFQVFSLTDARDRDTVSSFVPADLDTELPDYHSWYFDVTSKGSDPHKLVRFSPVPNQDAILERFETRMKSNRRVLFI